MRAQFKHPQRKSRQLHQLSMTGKPHADKQRDNQSDAGGCQKCKKQQPLYLLRKMQQNRLLHQPHQVPLLPFKRRIVVIHSHPAGTDINIVAAVMVEQPVYPVLLIDAFQLHHLSGFQHPPLDCTVRDRQFKALLH